MKHELEPGKSSYIQREELSCIIGRQAGLSRLLRKAWRKAVCRLGLKRHKSKGITSEALSHNRQRLFLVFRLSRRLGQFRPIWQHQSLPVFEALT